MEKMDRSESKFIWIGNHPCLDFINTQPMGKNNQPVDRLEDFPDLTAWLVEAQILDTALAKDVIKRGDDPSEAQQVLEQARTFRDLLREAIERIRKRKPIPQSTLDEINKWLATHTGYSELVRTRNGFTERFRLEMTEPIHLISPIAKTASDLLCHTEFSLIKRCENSACVLYFYDTTKNHKRRWCSMRICGNRMKVAAFYERRRLAQKGETG
jgi:predicted RNA-binding Zn ribbon-like protein